VARNRRLLCSYGSFEQAGALVPQYDHSSAVTPVVETADALAEARYLALEFLNAAILSFDGAFEVGHPLPEFVLMVPVGALPESEGLLGPFNELAGEPL
jgi:hypothetical protein